MFRGQAGVSRAQPGLLLSRTSSWSRERLASPLPPMSGGWFRPLLSRSDVTQFVTPIWPVVPTAAASAICAGCRSAWSVSRVSAANPKVASTHGTEAGDCPIGAIRHRNVAIHSTCGEAGLEALPETWKHYAGCVGGRIVILHIGSSVACCRSSYQTGAIVSAWASASLIWSSASAAACTTSLMCRRLSLYTRSGSVTGIWRLALIDHTVIRFDQSCPLRIRI